ncbi:histidine phosphatase family protein [Azospirillum sp. ST 5-10]|uniref:histidine phosphatase family protein n=1 Tax=unclassified Azospirillum TaxID=2630922 RepID=UPI003F4A5B27
MAEGIGGGFHLVRHGETPDNVLGVRCGGDRDVPLTARGVADARAAAARFAASGRPCGVVIAGPLQRTAVTGALFAEALGVPLQEAAWLRERRLGAWNGLGVAETRPWLAAGLAPPGGEDEETFAARVLAGIAGLEDRLAQWPLLVASKGIGRVLLHRLAGMPGVELENCAVVGFARAAAADGAPWRCDRRNGSWEPHPDGARQTRSMER